MEHGKGSTLRTCLCSHRLIPDDEIMIEVIVVCTNSYLIENSYGRFYKI